MKNLIASDAVRRAVRTFVIAFLGIAVPGFLGFLNDVTAWASANGQRPFPDAHNLTFILVSAVSAAMIAILNLLWVVVEDMSGHALLRQTTPPAPPGGVAPPPPNAGGQVGSADVALAGIVALLGFAIGVAALGIWWEVIPALQGRL
jgi:hypothetical protein